MYRSFYGLEEKPFDISTDPKFLWLGEKHKEAFSVLKYGVLENKGFLLLTGDVGAGKTTLIHALVESLGEDVIHATIPDPGLDLMDFFKYLARAFNLDNSFSNKADFIFIFREFLHHAYDNGKKALLIIDEAQRLSNELLEEIRLLSNIELHNMKLLNIFFVGQMEFNTKLLEPENRAVRQRLTISNHIQPLSEKETGDYIRHRLKVAGSQKNIFSYVAIHEVYKFSGGYPRLINIICDICLLSGYVKEVKKIGKDIVAESIESLNIESHTRQMLESIEKKSDQNGKENPAPYSGNQQNPLIQPVIVRQNGWPRSATVYVCLLLTVFVGYILYSNSYLTSMKKYVENLERSVPRASTQKNADLPLVVPNKQDHEVKSEQKNIFPLIETGERDPLPMDGEKSNVDASGADIGTNSSVDQSIETPLPGIDTKTQESDSRIDSDFNFVGNKLVFDFKHNSNEFSDEGYQILEKLSRFMKMNPDVFIRVVGYTDDMGSYSYNVNLSSFRANIVKSYLAGKGVDVARIQAVGLGPENPRASNSTPEGRRYNRRVEIEIMNNKA
ncbi:MAG: AAA family ATPase [Proteobacteria bacterium]|nr:AAA family ATPase [Pseudomonadota bacterium]